MDIDLRINPHPFCTSCILASIITKAHLKELMIKERALKSIYMDVISSRYRQGLTSKTNIKSYLLMVNTHIRFPKLYGLEETNTKAIIDKQDKCIASLGSWISLAGVTLTGLGQMSAHNLSLRSLKKGCAVHRVNLMLASPEHQETNKLANVVNSAFCVHMHLLLTSFPAAP